VLQRVGQVLEHAVVGDDVELPAAEVVAPRDLRSPRRCRALPCSTPRSRAQLDAHGLAAGDRLRELDEIPVAQPTSRWRVSGPK
jgi:hypothetical protein